MNRLLNRVNRTTPLDSRGSTRYPSILPSSGFNEHKLVQFSRGIEASQLMDEQIKSRGTSKFEDRRILKMSS